MGEFWDIYDENRVKTGRTAERDKYEFKETPQNIEELQDILVGYYLNYFKK